MTKNLFLKINLYYHKILRFAQNDTNLMTLPLNGKAF